MILIYYSHPFMSHWWKLIYKVCENVIAMIPLSENDNLEIPYNDNGELNSRGKELFNAGVEVLKSGKKLGAVILSGGEGTRLGLTYPKGLFEIEGKTLFEWHLERLQSLQKKYGTEIYLFVMTSNSTDAQVREFFTKNKYNFLKGVDIFKQNGIEALDMKTKNPLKKDKNTIYNPVGNGDFFEAIKQAPNMEKVEAFNVISVDNILANILDEVFVGMFFSKKLDALSKAVKALKNESVGAFVMENNHIKIQEYSESKSQEGTSLYGNICNHIFSTEFVKLVGTKELPMHEAFKKIPFTDESGKLITPSEPNGIKREKFIFDSFEFTAKNAVMVVNRNLEFSPLKNSLSNESANPKTCAEAVKKVRIPKGNKTYAN